MTYLRRTLSSLLMLLTFITYVGNVSLFSHRHTIDGQTVVHSHIYSGDGEQPDHTVVVLSCDMDSGTISVYDPNSSNETDCYPLTQFMDAWNDSKNYMVTARITKD